MDESRRPDASAGRTASACSNTWRAAGKASTRSFAIPGFCDPCPGNRSTKSMAQLEAHDHRAPREASPKGNEEDDAPFLDASHLDGFVQRDRHGGRGRIPEAIHVHVDLVHRNAGVL